VASPKEVKPKRLPDPATNPVPGVEALHPERLIAYFKGHTELQAKQLLQPWIGQKVSWSGVVKSVSDQQVGTDGSGGADVYLLFDPKFDSRLARLEHGDTITVVGTIGSAHGLLGGTVILSDCEFIDG